MSVEICIFKKHVLSREERMKELRSIRDGDTIYASEETQRDIVRQLMDIGEEFVEWRAADIHGEEIGSRKRDIRIKELGKLLDSDREDWDILYKEYQSLTESDSFGTISQENYEMLICSCTRLQKYFGVYGGSVHQHEIKDFLCDLELTAVEVKQHALRNQNQMVREREEDNDGKLMIIFPELSVSRLLQYMREMYKAALTVDRLNSYEHAVYSFSIF